LNRKTLLIIITLTLAAYCGFPVYAGQLSISVTGLWKVNLNATDLSAGAGSGFANPFVSLANEARIRVSNATLPNWSISIRKVDSTWDTDLPIYAKRTGPGSGGTVTGGDAYQLITNTDTVFFSGTGEPMAIPIQYYIDINMNGISALSYVTAITYTIIGY